MPSRAGLHSKSNGQRLRATASYFKNSTQYFHTNEGKKYFTFCTLHFSSAGNEFQLALCASHANGVTTKGSEMFPQSSVSRTRHLWLIESVLFCIDIISFFLTKS